MKLNLSLLLFLAAASLFAAEKPLKDFKAGLKYSHKAPFICTTDFVSAAPSVKLDSADFPQKPIISTAFYAFQHHHPAMRGQVVRFKAMVKRGAGNAELSITFRCFSTPDNELIAYKEVKFTPPKDKANEFFPVSGDFTVPDIDHIGNVNISVGYRNTGNVRNLWILDNIVFVTVDGDPSEEVKNESTGLRLWEKQSPLQLIAGGEPRFTIALPDRPDAITLMAAAELQEHVRLAAGKAPAILPESQVKGPAIYLGETQMAIRHGIAPSMQQPDHFVITRMGDAVILAGGEHANTPKEVIFDRTPAGTLYAVYEFLESQLGVRWYHPGKLGTAVPPTKELVIGNLYRKSHPVAETRWLFHRESADPAIPNQEMLLWQKRQRTGAGAGNATGMHAFQRWPKKFGATHPEYFALQSDGTRKINDDSGVHLCLTNPAVLQTAINEKIEIFRANPAQRFSNIMPGDCNTLYNCRCKNCLKQTQSEKGDNGVHSNMVWNFVNQVADGVAKVLPDRVITCCAYADYQQKPDFALSPHVAVTLCFEDFPQDNPKYKAKLKKLLDDWSSTGARLYLWEYWCFPRMHRGTLGSVSFFARSRPEMQRITEGRVDGFLLELPFYDLNGKCLDPGNQWIDWPFDVMNLYVSLKLMWKPDADVDALLEEYFTLFFGPAAQPVREFYHEMEAAWGNRTLSQSNWDWAMCWKKVYSPELVDRVMALLVKGVKLSEGQEPYYARTKQLLDGFRTFEESSRRFRAPAPLANSKEIKLHLSQGHPVIDGKPDEAIWQSAAVAKNFIDSYAVYSAQSTSIVRMLRDDTRLYLAVTAKIPESHKKTKFADDAGIRDGLLWNYEGMEFFFADAQHHAVQFILAPDGKLADFRHPSARSIDWNADGIEFATVRTADGWTGELSIPLAVLPKNGGKWLINFARNHYFRNTPEESWTWEQSCWQPTFGPFNTYSRFGELIFE